MIFTTTGTNAATAATTSGPPQLFNSGLLQLPIGPYSGTHINYRDSSWLKLTVCELFLKSDCPNVDNCSLAHPPPTVKVENHTVTVCYDYIKKKDCKHNNCKYYHPHDALASAILRRGDDSKKNGALNGMGLPLGFRNTYSYNRSQDLLNLQTQNYLSSQFHNANDQMLKSKLESVCDAKKIKQEAEEPNSSNLTACNSIASVPGIITGPQPPVTTFNILQPNPTTCGVGAGNINTYPTAQPIMLPSTMLANPNISNNLNMETIFALAAAANQQRVAATAYQISPGGYPQLTGMTPGSVTTTAPNPLLNSLYYQQMLQNPFGIPTAAAPGPGTGILYPGTPINFLDLQQRALEETSVAFINDKGTILETLPVCKDFLQGKCKRGQSCNYVHLLDTHVEVKDSKVTVCKNALKGQCHRVVCKFYHIPSYQLQKLGISSL